MEQLKIAFCDDDPIFRSRMRPAVEEAFLRHGWHTAALEASSATELSAAIEHTELDLIFLDIDMPGMDGIRFGEELRRRGCEADIIYVSNMAERVYDIFRVHPWSFLRKSHFSDEISAVVAEYVHSHHERRELFLPGTDGTTHVVNPKDILYVEAAGKHQKIVLQHGPAQRYIHSTLHELEQQLLPFGFIRIHKGFLVNYRFIGKITSRSVLLDTGEDIPIGRNRVKAVREEYLALMKWKGLSRGPLPPSSQP